MLNFQRPQSSVNSQVCSEESTTSKKIHSLIPDLITGWRPKNIKIPSPIIIKYKSPLVTQLLQYYSNDTNNIVYLGQRNTNSYHFHQKIQHQYFTKYGIKSQDLPKFLKKQLFLDDSNQNKLRSFQGMNPNVKNNCYIFQSRFESGNLDLVIKVSNNQYNLFLRPDTNTCGHMQWFYFTIKNISKGKIRLNICNNKKQKTLYQRGMKPYILSKNQQNKNKNWYQSGQNLSYKKMQLRQSLEQKQIDGVIKRVNIFQKYYTLSFDYTFQTDNDQVSFAYSPPYTYSHLKNTVTQIKSLTNCFQNIVLQQKFCTSLSGVDIPILTITDHSISNETKICIIAIGRMHPGQSNGSYVIQGFINHVCSQQARQIRKNIVFKIIPMINPDGVIFGNYRTSLSGKDLNRSFRTKNTQLLPQINQLKNLIKNLKNQFKGKIMYFLDFHGHSLKKNVFFYGPQYDIWSVKYQKSKQFPKALANKTDMFRLKSCIFKIASFKKSTARAFMLTHIPYCYTVETSVGIYRDQKQQDHYFTIKLWKQVGKNIGQSLNEILQNTIQKNNVMLLRKILKKKKTQINFTNQNSHESQQKILSPKNKQIFNTTFNNINEQVKIKKYLNPIRNLKQKTFLDKQIQKIDQQSNQSDHFQQGDSDCQSQQNDLPKIQYQKLKEKIVNLIDDFQFLMVGKKKGICNTQIRQKKTIKVKKQTEKSKKKHEQVQMVLVPSLKYRLSKISLSEKKISNLSPILGQLNMNYTKKIKLLQKINKQ